MKKLILLLCTLHIVTWLYSKEDPNMRKYFLFNQNFKVYGCDADGILNGDSAVITPNIIFKVVGTTKSNDFIINILKDTKDDAWTRTYHNEFYGLSDTQRTALLNEKARRRGQGVTLPPTIITTSKDDKGLIYYIVPRIDFDRVCRSKGGYSLSLGLVSLPLKMRFGSKEKVDGKWDRNFLVSSDVAIGASVGVKYKWSGGFAINFLGGVSYNAVEVDSSTTKGLAKSAGNAMAVGFHFGILGEVNNFQVGIFTGIDCMTGQYGKDWIYRGQPWLGIGLGYTLFKTKSTTDSQ